MFGVYGACRRRVTESTGRSELKPSEIFACARRAGRRRAAVLTPVELVGQGTSTWATLAATLRAGGLPALYVGYGSALVRGVPGAAVVFAVYGSVEARLREDT
ncbi:hypothetical protein SO694_00006040 [Aureococcus anophagefferens]|uniref:Uncharacterized protein n=1 Tax=Aureococcus anophagefferens TaxID=44056 RepID=A0ABR1G9R9_AURAN